MKKQWIMFSVIGWLAALQAYIHEQSKSCNRIYVYIGSRSLKMTDTQQ